jgi:hypothetical protein
MSESFRPLSAQEEVNMEKEEQEEYDRLIGSSDKKKDEASQITEKEALNLCDDDTYS